VKPTSPRLRILASRSGVALFLILLVFWGWPATTTPLLNDDSLAYLNWPTPLMVEGIEVMGARAPVYPLLLKALGAGPGLLHFQTWFSLVCWCLLGWVGGRFPGLVATGLLALLIALGLLMMERRSLALFLTWSLIIVLFGFLRDSNLVLLPFLLPPALRHSRPRKLAAVSLVCAVVITGAAFAQQQRHWVIPYYNAVEKRVLPDPRARAEFEAAGMPSDIFRDQAREFRAWFLDRGQSTYQKWVLARSASYREAGRNLVRANESARLQELYFESFADLPMPWVTNLSEILFRALAWPLLFGILLLSIPIWEVRCKRRMGGLSGWILVLAVGIYIQAFATFHGDGVEIERHMLVATVLYRIGLLLSLSLGATLLLEKRLPDHS